MKEYYEMTIAGCTRRLPLCKASDDLVIAGFVIFGDVEITEKSAAALLAKAPEFDYIVAPEAKSIPLLYEMAKQAGRNDYVLIRKKMKLYMQNPLETTVQSITTEGVQHLYMNGKDAEMIKGKRVLLIDDVISTGESIASAAELVEKAGGNIVAKMCILAEGESAKRDDIIFLEPLPLFDSEGNPKN